MKPLGKTDNITVEFTVRVDINYADYEFVNFDDLNKMIQEQDLTHSEAKEFILECIADNYIGDSAKQILLEELYNYSTVKIKRSYEEELS